MPSSSRSSERPVINSLRNVFINIRKTVQRILREMLDTWLSLKADEIQKYADRKDLDGLYEAFGTLHGPQPHGTSVY